MEIPIEKTAAELLNDLENQKTPECLTVDTLGEYIEHSLPSEDWDGVEKHLRSCLYCLNQLVELRELLFLEKNAEPLPRALQRKLLRGVAGKPEKPTLAMIESLGDRLRSALEIIRLTLNSKYTWQGAFAVLLAFLVLRFPGLYKPNTEDNTQKIASEVSESIVTVRLTDAKGATVQRVRGLIVDPTGYVVPLQVLPKSVAGEAALTDGSIIPIKGIKVDENSNLVLIKLDTSTTLKAPSLVDYTRVRTGDAVLAISQDEPARFRVEKAVLGDYVPSPPKGRSRETEPVPLRQFIPIASTGDRIPQGILTDRSGAVIGVSLVLPEGERAGLAVPISRVQKLVASSVEPKPLGEATFQVHPQEAVYYYVKGVLADDAGNKDLAMSYYKKCLEIDPNYDQAHLALGYLYYQEGDHDREMSHYKDAIEANPSNADAFSSLAAALEDRQEYHLAIEAYERAIEIEPKDTDTRKSLAIDYLVIGRRDKAVEQYDALKSINKGAANDLKRILDLASTKSGM
jgi:Tfp pilus assembly protein PilF